MNKALDPSSHGWRRILRTALSRLSSYTPGVFYYSADFPAEINGTLRTMPIAGEAGSGMSKAAVSICCAFSEELEAGDIATFRLHGITSGNQRHGDFIVTVERVAND